VLGGVSTFMQERYGLAAQCTVVTFTGDNPASFAAMSLSPGNHPRLLLETSRAASGNALSRHDGCFAFAGDMAVSMGTSDTVLLALRPPITPQREGHVMCSPVHDDGTAMGMLCFSNGSLVREAIMVCTEMLRADFAYQVVLCHTAWLGACAERHVLQLGRFRSELATDRAGQRWMHRILLLHHRNHPARYARVGQQPCRGMG
jgi:sugar (pentulose or hexulose) kinase